MVDFILEFGDFVKNFITSCPDIFKHVFVFLTDIISYIKDLFVSGQILIGIIIVFLLVKLVGFIRSAI